VQLVREKDRCKLPPATSGFNAKVAATRLLRGSEITRRAQLPTFPARYFFDVAAGAGSKTSAAASPAADAMAAAVNSQM
jgi:hypothetical protein